MRLAEIIKELEIIEYTGELHLDISGISRDSRDVKPGYLFVCISGLRYDGHDYIAQAISKGAVAVVCQNWQAISQQTTMIRVADTRAALSRISSFFYGEPSKRLLVIGITGTNGKTTTSYYIQAMLRAAGKKAAIIGTTGMIMDDRTIKLAHTTPEAADIHKAMRMMLNEGYDAVVMEVSSHALAQERVDDICFDAAVFTNISDHEHLDYHGDFAAYLAAKLRLVDLLERSEKPSRLIVTNLDDEHFSPIKPAGGILLSTYGILSSPLHSPSPEGEGANASPPTFIPPRFGGKREEGISLFACNIEATIHGNAFTLCHGEKTCAVRLFIPGYYNIYNALAAAAVGIWLRLELKDIAHALHSVKSVPGRFQSITEGQDFSVIVDYAHSSDALSNLLSAARRCSPRRLITVFGCGGDRDRSKRPLMAQAAQQYSDHIIVTSDNPRSEDPFRIIDDIMVGFNTSTDKIERIEDRKQAIFRAIELASPGDMVIIAGKGHENYQVLGDKIIHFDDAEVASEALRALRANGEVEQ